MQHTARVGEPHGVANAQEQTQPVRQGSHSFDMFVQPLAFYKFHGVKNAALAQRADVMHGNNSRVLQAREHASFAIQPAGEVAVRNRNVQDLKRHAASQHFITRRVDHTHAAASDALQQLVARSGEVRDVGVLPQTIHRLVGEKLHAVSEPKTARASRWNSSSLPQSSCSRSNAIRRNSRRAQESALVTSVTGIAYSAASFW